MKYLISLLLIFSYVQLTAQSEKNFIVTTSLGYNYVYEDQTENLSVWPTTQADDRKINDLKFTVAIGRKFKTNFYYGIGLSVNTLKEEVNPDYRNFVPENTGYYQITVRGHYIMRSNVYSPMAYLQYNMDLGERFRFFIDLFGQYDFAKTTTESTVFQTGLPIYFPTDSLPIIPDNINFENNSTRKQEFLTMGIVPGLKINLYKSFGMNVTLGSMAYRIKTAESRLPDTKKSREFSLRFTPDKWTVGIHLAF